MHSIPILLWISRHDLWPIQEYLLRSLHGKKCPIEKTDQRFTDSNHFLSFLNEHQKGYIPYGIIPNPWREEAWENGYSLGIVYKPYTIKDQRKKTRIFRIEYYEAGVLVKSKNKQEVYGSKGYYCRINRA